MSTLFVSESYDVSQSTITDLSGRVVGSMEKNIIMGSNKITWSNLSHLASGHYYIKVSSLENGFSFLRKLSK